MTPTLQTSVVPAEQLIGDQNIRLSLRKGNIESLMDDIVREGEIHTPLEVEALSEPVPEAPNAAYRVNDGHRRLEAANRLKNERGIEILIPIVIKQSVDGIARLKRQVSHAVQTESLSPIDTGIAMRTLLGAQVPRPEIRALFPRPSGKRGEKMESASNAFMNMMISFLDFPKNIQTKIHEGVIGVAAAYSLTKKPKEAWAAIVAECEASREEAINDERSMEEKYLVELKKAEDKLVKQRTLEAAAADASAKVDKLEEVVKEKLNLESVAYVGVQQADKETKDKAVAALKAAQAATKEVQKERDSLLKEAESNRKKLEAVKEQADARKKKLEAARKATNKTATPKDGKKAIGTKDVDKAAAKLGHGNLKPLNATDMRSALDDWSHPSGSPRLEGVITAIRRCFQGELTPNQAFGEMLKATGEKVSKK